MKPYKIIKKEQALRKPIVINKLKESRIPLRFFKMKNPCVKRFIIEAPLDRPPNQDQFGLH